MGGKFANMNISEVCFLICKGRFDWILLDLQCSSNSIQLQHMFLEQHLPCLDAMLLEKHILANKDMLIIIIISGVSYTKNADVSYVCTTCEMLLQLLLKLKELLLQDISVTSYNQILVLEH